jgi:hypothetical protein
VDGAQKGSGPPLARQQTASQRIRVNQLHVHGTGSSTRSLVYVRAQVHDVEKNVVTTSNWLRWELGD